MKPMDKKEKAVLIVDDEKNIRELVRFNLESRGYKVLEAVDGKQALEKTSQQLPLLIILDLMLPKIDGLEVCRTLKANPKTDKIPIIMLTALGDEIDKIVGLELGADDYMTKPFSPRELIARIRAVLRRTGAQENKESLPEGLKIDEDKYEVLLNGKKLELTLKEFELLRLLASNPFHVFTRNGLLDKIWGFDFLGDTRTVDVHICNLRRKLEEYDKKGQYYIETVRGVGYRFGYRK